MVMQRYQWPEPPWSQIPALQVLTSSPPSGLCWSRLAWVSLVEFLLQAKGLDMGGRLPSAQMVQAASCPLGIEDGIHFVYLMTLDFNCWRWWYGLVKKRVLRIGLQKGNMENWMLPERQGKLEFEGNQVKLLAYWEGSHELVVQFAGGLEVCGSNSHLLAYHNY